MHLLQPSQNVWLAYVATGGGIEYEGNLREDVDWHQAYHGINVANIILDEIKEHDAVTSQAKLKIPYTGRGAFLAGSVLFPVGKPLWQTLLQG